MPLRSPANLSFLMVGILFAALTTRARGGEVPQFAILSADTEGHLNPCESCPTHAGLGGMARRATLLADARAHGSPLLLDAGNFLLGPDSAASGGSAIVAAYNVLAYDAVNLSWRDFRLGKARTLAVLRDAKFNVLSANLLDEATAKPLAQPWVLRKWHNETIAIIGLSEAPAGLDYLPHLREQLAGIRVQPPAEALAQWLPEIKSKAGRVIVLYYGSAGGFKPVRQKFGADLFAVFVGGERPRNLPAVAPLMVGTDEHGKSLAIASWSESGAAVELKVAQADVEATIAADPRMAALLASYQAQPAIATTTSPRAPSGPSSSPAIVTAPTGPATMPAIAATSPPATTFPMASTTPPTPPATPPPASSRRVAAHQDLPARGLAGASLTAEQVNAAIDRGAEFLWKYIRTKDLEAGKMQLGADAPHVLACLALVHAGAHKKFPDFDKALRDYLEGYPPNSYQTIYQYGLACMLIEAYGDPAYFSKQRMAARYLVEAQGPQGSWSYTANGPVNLNDDAGGPPLRVITGVTGVADPAEKGMDRLTPSSVGADGDNSCSQFALLGLHAASRCHLKISPGIWKGNLESCASRQNPDGGWAYHAHDGESYGSMTCAGICARAINRFELAEASPESDEAIERGLAWMDDHFSVSENPGRGGFLYYYLYSLERVGRILDTEFIGSHEWYPQGVRYLIDNQQKNGSWLEPSDTDPRNPTSFALLFLTRATPTLKAAVKHGGPGTLKPDVETPPPARLYIILDASGSMLDLMDGRQKFDLARGAVQGLVDRLPDGSQVALRVYGHRKRSIEEGSDEDTELAISMGPLDRAAFAATLKSLRPRGKTPLTLSLTEALGDLSGASAEEPVTLLLLTDGGEDTVPRRDPVKACDAIAAKKGVVFHVVGFDINQEDWGRQLHAMAAHAGGRYWPAARAGALNQQVTAAVFGSPDSFVLLDSAGREAARGPFGKAVQLPEGQYVFKTLFGGSEFSVPVPITTDATTGVLFDASRIRGQAGPATVPAAGAPAAATPAAVPSVGPPIPHKFCTNCGHPLPAGAKFCPTCGQIVK